MTVEPFLSRVYAFLIFPCASAVSYALPPTIVRSYAYQTFISPVSTPIRSYAYQTFILPVLVDTRPSYVRNSSKRRISNFRDGSSYEFQTYNKPLVIVWYTAVVLSCVVCTYRTVIDSNRMPRKRLMSDERSINGCVSNVTDSASKGDRLSNLRLAKRPSADRRGRTRSLDDSLLSTVRARAYRVSELRCHTTVAV